MKFFKAGLTKDQFLKQVIILVGGSGFAQGILVLAAPLLTRLYTPADFGALAVLFAVNAIALVGISWRYEMALPLIKTTSLAINLLVLSLVLVVLMTAMLALFLWGVQLAQWWHWPAQWVLLGAIWGAGSYQALKYWGLQQQRFKLLSVTQVVQALTQINVQLLLGILGWGYLGLLLGYMLAQWLGSVLLWRQTPIQLTALNRRRWLPLLRRYQHFPRYTLWASWINVLGWQLAPLLLASYFSAAVAGSYALTLRVLALPSAFIGQAVAQVFYPLAAQQTQNAQHLIERIIMLLWVVGLPLFALVGLHGPLLFQWLFGEDWQTAGVYARWLAPWLLLALIASPLSTFALVKAQQRRAFWLSVYETGLRALALFIGVRAHSEMLAIQLFSAAGCIISLVYISWVLQLAGSHIIIVLKRLKKVLAVNIAVIISLKLLIVHLSPLSGLSLTVLGLAGLVFWCWKQIYE